MLIVETLALEIFSFICDPFSPVYFPITCSPFSRRQDITVASKRWACHHIIFTCRISFGLLEVIDPLLRNERRKVESPRNSKKVAALSFFSCQNCSFMIENSKGVSVNLVQYCALTYQFKAPL